MKVRNTGIPALILTCAFAMFAIAAIPEAAKASSYYNGIDLSLCTDVFCGDFYYGDDYGYGGNVYIDGVELGFDYYEPVTYSYPQYQYYTYPTYSYYTYPTVVQRPRRTPDYFFRDYARAANDWDAQMRYYNSRPL